MKIKKFKRFVIVLILFLCPQTLFGMGFSSWLICNDTGGTLTTEGVIHAADVIDYYSYVKMNRAKGETHNGITALRYNSTGFVKDETFGNEGQTTYYVYFDINGFYGDYENFSYANLSFEISLRNNNNSLISYVSSSSVSYLFGTNLDYSSGLTTLTSNLQKDGNKAVTAVSLASFNQSTYIGKYLFLEVTYTFAASSSLPYSTLYNQIQNTNIDLLFDVYIEGCE